METTQTTAYTPTNEEMIKVKELALLIHENKVFGEWQIPQNSLSSIILVFMSLIFMEQEDKLKLKDFIIYGKWDEAGPRGINGMPMFDRFYMFERKLIVELERQLSVLGHMKQLFLNHNVIKDKNETERS